MSEPLSALLAEQFLLPVLRCPDPDDAVATALALRDGGFRCVELTMTTPEVGSAVERLTEQGLTVGVGTLTRADQVAGVVAAGAAFVVSFCRPSGLLAAAAEARVPAIPGALTPSEVFGCWEEGARWVKLFPARAISPGHIGDLRPLLPRMRYLVTGGVRVDAESLGAWWDAGAWAVGAGGELGTAATVGVAEVERRAAAATQLVARLRAERST